MDRQDSLLSTSATVVHLSANEVLMLAVRAAVNNGERALGIVRSFRLAVTAAAIRKPLAALTLVAVESDTAMPIFESGWKGSSDLRL